uniref:Uncharacterized protein n=1 Tax=viral metagenome TaxID=1070528 RepID=A0A6H1ZWF4_9ZZZZ
MENLKHCEHHLTEYPPDPRYYTECPSCQKLVIFFRVDGWWICSECGRRIREEKEVLK